MSAAPAMPRNCDSTAIVGSLATAHGAALPINPSSMIAIVAVSLALAACAATPPADQGATGATAATTASASPAATPPSQTRDLTPDEKKIIVEAVAPSLRNPGAAKYKWTKFPMVPPADEVSYCGTVDAQSPYAAYSGHQAYIVDTKVAGGHITSAAMGLITGGKDIAIVAGMCAKHGLDPNAAG
jgi:hypothetical protein